MKFKNIFYSVVLFTNGMAFSQVPHDINVASNGTAERVARFKVQDEARDFLEITNSTNNPGAFIPSIWGHQESDNRYSLRHFASTKSSLDNGSTPLMIFRSELRNAINLNAPSGGTFPWGTSATNVVNRPVFAWENGNTQLMTIRANGNIGIGTTTPQEKLHLNGSIRGNAAGGSLRIRTGSGFIDIGSQNPFFGHIYTDRPRMIFNKPVYVIGGRVSSHDTSDLFLQTNGTTRVTVNNSTGNVGIGTTGPSAKLHTNGTLRFQNLPNATTPSFLLGTDASGNVKEYPSNAGGGGVTLIPCLGQTNRLTKITSLGDLTCSQIYDDGIRVGIGTTSPTADLHNIGTVRLQDLPYGTISTYLGVDVDGNVKRVEFLNNEFNNTDKRLSNFILTDNEYLKDVEELDNSLASILKLNGKLFQWKDGLDKYQFPDGKQIGFIAQEVKEVLPEIIHVDKNGEHSMNYTAIIPVLVEAIKEQQNQITLLQNKLDDSFLLFNDSNLILEKRTSFSTNYPNPFSTTTTVDYFIEKNVYKAKIVIYDTNGTTINSFNLNDRARTLQLIINKNNLSSGVYFYTLIADDIVIGTKKMIVK